MSASAAIADVQVKGTGLEARGRMTKRNVSLSTRVWLLCDFAMNRHESGRITSHVREAMMKKLLAAVGGMMLLITRMAFAESGTSVIEQRQTNQEQRIDQGIVDGQRETNRVNEQQEQVNKMENKEQSDSVMTEKERARIIAAQARTSQYIAREKHDHRGKAKPVIRSSAKP